jgi:hypothetical protein
MKKSLILLATAMLAAASFTGCKKGEEDPGLSLRSRAGRFEGTWALVERTTCQQRACRYDVRAVPGRVHIRIGETWHLHFDGQPGLTRRLTETTRRV